jgi:hypothetical protein
MTVFGTMFLFERHGRGVAAYGPRPTWSGQALAGNR